MLNIIFLDNLFEVLSILCLNRLMLIYITVEMYCLNINNIIFFIKHLTG